MPIPYLFTTLIYAFVALLVATDASLVSVNFIDTFPALRWVRAHFITLGIVSQVIFGMLPTLTALLSKKPRSSMRWDIWLTLNVGFVSLVIQAASVQAYFMSGVQVIGEMLVIGAVVCALSLIPAYFLRGSGKAAH